MKAKTKPMGKSEKFTRSSCSDENPCNAFGYDGESGVFTSSGCTRCSLMRVASGAELPPDFNLRQL